MIKFENTKVIGWEAAIRGMRNPMNSWERSDSGVCQDFKCGKWGENDKRPICPFSDPYMDGNCGCFSDYIIGQNDLDLMRRLAAGGPVHAKYRRMIIVYVDITAPLYWWKEFDTYKVGTVANSCSTMHKIHAKEFTLEDFSCEHLLSLADNGAGYDYHCMVRNSENRNEFVDGECVLASMECLELTINVLNIMRHRYLKTKDKKYWWQLIELLPSSYNQKRTVMMNYEVLAGIYPMRKNHKLDEWSVGFVQWIESLPFAAELITYTGKEENGQ